VASHDHLIIRTGSELATGASRKENVMRGFLRTAGLIFVVCAVAGGAIANDYFPQSVASGDPRPDSVVLWTRIDNPDIPDAIQVEVATDEAFTNVVFTRQLTASADNDWCLKVLVEGLEAYTTYYYRFVYGTGAVMEYSTVGRTKTAPTPEMAVPVRFAVAYGQDYIGRYYNTYLKLLVDHDEDIDFVVHLGDYIYETTGDPAFQDPTDERKIEFDDIDGAIPLGSEDDRYYAAASLSNYRDLYRTYRSDPMLQQVHERWPMIVIWDDHEYPSRPSTSGSQLKRASAPTVSSQSTTAISTRTPVSIATFSTVRCSTWCSATTAPSVPTTWWPRTPTPEPSRWTRRLWPRCSVKRRGPRPGQASTRTSTWISSVRCCQFCARPRP